MARKKNNSSEKTYTWIGHVQYYFNDSEIVECVAWLAEREPDPLEALDVMTQAEVGVKITSSNTGEGYHVTMQTKDKHSLYYGYTIGITHSDLRRAIMIALYVVVELMENEGIPLPDSKTYPEW